jgi:hypothetical protein
LGEKSIYLHEVSIRNTLSIGAKARYFSTVQKILQIKLTMPIIQGKNTNQAADDFQNWGYVQFSAGQKNITEPHFHDCDEYIFMISGRMLMRSEGILYTCEASDLLVTRMGDVHEVIEILEDTAYFWAMGGLRGLKRNGHLDPSLPGCNQPA